MRRRRSPLGPSDQHNVYEFFVEKSPETLTWQIYFSAEALAADLVVHWRYLFERPHIDSGWRLFEDALQAAAWTQPLDPDEERALREAFPTLPRRPRYNETRLEELWDEAEPWDPPGEVAAQNTIEEALTEPEKRPAWRARKIQV